MDKPRKWIIDKLRPGLTVTTMTQFEYCIVDGYDVPYHTCEKDCLATLHILVTHRIGGTVLLVEDGVVHLTDVVCFDPTTTLKLREVIKVPAGDICQVCFAPCYTLYCDFCYKEIKSKEPRLANTRVFCFDCARAGAHLNYDISQ